VVLIVTMFFWSVNRKTMACDGSQSRAAVVVQAGSPPATPEPSLSRHNCCPNEKRKTAQPQISFVTKCKMRTAPNYECCEVGSATVITIISAKVTRVEIENLLATIYPGQLPIPVDSDEKIENRSISAKPQVFVTHSILRLWDLPRLNVKFPFIWSRHGTRFPVLNT